MSEPAPDVAVWLAQARSGCTDALGQVLEARKRFASALERFEQEMENKT